jgi:hypothetical protein
MALDLYHRLQQLQKARERGQTPRGTGAPAQPASSEATEHERQSECVERSAAQERAEERAQERERAPIPGWEALGEFVYRRVERSAPLEHDIGLLRDAFLLPGDAPPERLCFYDLETTGLSAGAGTLAFLCGVGRLQADGSVEVVQLFLADYPGEPRFLRELSALFADADHLVSYNGKAFDMNILRNRYIMNRLEPPALGEVDLLYPTRRLYGGSLERCGLTEVGTQLLGLERDGDLPGSMVPDAYLDFLKAGDRRLLDNVFRHHVHDILTLPMLLLEIEAEVARVKRGEDPGRVDGFELGRMLAERARDGSDVQAAERLLWSLLSDGEHRGRAARSVSVGRYLGRHHRRKREWEHARTAWETLVSRWRVVSAAIELSKYFEHRSRELTRARDTLQAALSWPHSRVYREDIRYRLARIERKIAGRARS